MYVKGLILPVISAVRVHTTFYKMHCRPLSNSITNDESWNFLYALHCRHLGLRVGFGQWTTFAWTILVHITHLHLPIAQNNKISSNTHIVAYSLQYKQAAFTYFAGVLDTMLITLNSQQKSTKCRVPTQMAAANFSTFQHYKNKMT